jgi:short-subunit dehydrogenase
MAIQLKPLRDQVVVITGASSGIGRATALEGGRRGAAMILAARSELDLQRVCEQIRAAGGKAAYFVCDMSAPAEVESLASFAIDRFGRIDSWINNAGVGLYARLLDGNLPDERRVFDVNFWGVVNGSKTAVRRMQNGGALINVGSVAGDMAFPLQGIYCASKHAIKAFTDGLRIELGESGLPISVTLIKPAAIDTPFPQHARNYMSREPKLPDPAYTAEEVANAILYSCEHSKRDVYVGGFGRMLTVIQKFAPAAMDWFAQRGEAAAQLRQEPARRPQGSHATSGHENKIAGEHPGYVAASSAYMRASTNPIINPYLVAVAGLAASLVLFGRSDAKRLSSRRRRS